VEGFILGLVDGSLLAGDDLGLQRQESLSAGQAQLQDLMSLTVAALGVVEIATGAFDLASGPSLAGVIDDEGALGARPPVIGVIDPPR